VVAGSSKTRSSPAGKPLPPHAGKRESPGNRAKEGRAPSTAQTSNPGFASAGDTSWPGGIGPHSGWAPSRSLAGDCAAGFRTARDLPPGRAEYQSHGAGRYGLRSAAKLADGYRIWLEPGWRRWWSRYAARPSSTVGKTSPAGIDATRPRVQSVENRASQMFVTRGILVTVSIRLGLLSAPDPHDRLGFPLCITSRNARSKVPASVSFGSEEHLVDSRQVRALRPRHSPGMKPHAVKYGG